MARDKISDLYERGRVFPHGKNSEDHPAPQSVRSYDRSPKDGALRRNTPQDIEDRHTEPRYSNDHPNDWIRGRGESATGKPFFDKQNAYRQSDGCVKRAAPPSASDRRDSGLSGGRLVGNPPKVK